MNADRNLTDADVDAIVLALTVKVKQEFYEDLGRGLWDVVWKTVVGVLVGIAAYGALRGFK